MTMGEMGWLSRLTHVRLNPISKFQNISFETKLHCNDNEKKFSESMVGIQGIEEEKCLHVIRC